MRIRFPSFHGLFLGIALLALVAAVALPASASSLTGAYYKVAYGQNPDFENGIDGGPVMGLVTSTLGPNGLPVASALGKTYGGPSGPITDIDSVTDEILWWSASGQGVAFEKTQVDVLDFNFSNFFPDGETGNSNYYRTVSWHGTFVLPSPGTVTFGLGADDDAFVYIDGQLKVDNGGVKALSYVPNVIGGLSAGTHDVDVFFADRHTVQSALKFTSDIQLEPTHEVIPEASTLMLGILGLGGIVGPLRRFRK
jgi:fibro-slime domain-containing protein